MSENRVRFVKGDLEKITVDGTRIVFETVDGPQELRVKDHNRVAEVLNGWADWWTPIYENGRQINPNYGDTRYVYGPPKRTFRVDPEK
ncbi:MAG: hypothetical protein ACRDTT_00740 [Pseudonocardiaceae bacterium]